MNPYNSYFFNYPNHMMSQANRLNQLEQQYPQFANNGYMNNNPSMMNNVNNMNHTSMQNNMFIQGKAVDSLDVVKAIDAPLDGTITYFPKTDGTEIYTKQLQRDGTSKISVYSINNSVQKEEPKNNVSNETINKIYMNIEELKASINEIKENIYKPQERQSTPSKTEKGVHK